jgi:hypothetical protein
VARQLSDAAKRASAGWTPEAMRDGYRRAYADLND